MTWVLVGATLRITLWLRTRMQTASRDMELLIADALTPGRVVDQQDTQK